MTMQEVDKIVCEWSMKYRVAMSQQALNALVEQIAFASAEPLEEEYIDGPKPQ